MKSKTKLKSKAKLNSKTKLNSKANLKPNLKDAKEQTLLRVSIFLILFGNLLGISLGLWQSRHPDIVTDLKRSEYNESIHEESLKFQTDDGKTHHITLKVPSKTYSKEESQTLLDEASKKLDSSILGKNKSFSSIHTPLSLPESLPDCPVQLFWTTSDPKILDYTGAIGEDVPSKGASVMLRCQLSLEEETLSWQKELYVYPEKLSKEKSLNASIQKAVTNDSSSNPTLALPDSIDGQHLFFYKEPAKTGLFVCIFFSLLGFLLLPLKRQKEQEKIEKQKVLMQRDYPDIVSKLLLFLHAGLTIRASLEKIADDYQKNYRSQNLPKRPAYEALLETCHELKGGLSQPRAYENFGSRCPCPEYKILSVLLIQNLKKGNQNTLLLLEKEVTDALENRKRKARILGEEAQTKLLFPMLLQLVIVLALLMLPAFLSFT